tara:strand:- start:2368 stop:5889 length:3522 start_codon:yes stop_codon:yes gene_type:complete
MRRLLSLLLVALLLPSFSQLSTATSGRAVNIDLAVGDISISYPDTTNSSLYQMFSSNYPIANFNRPADLYVTDSIIGVEIEIDVTIQNQGTVQSGSVDFNLLVLHNEYQHFELLNFSNTMSPINGGSSNSVKVLWTPNYAGNHTMQITVSNPNGDDDNSDNSKNRHMTVALHYDNCVDLTTWSKTGEWKTNSEVYISELSGCHIGNGATSFHSNNLVSTLTTPVFDMADGLNSHNAAIGYSFFYTGGAGVGDSLKGYAKDSQSNWDELWTITGAVDNDFNDGINWQTFSATYNGKNSPLVPIENKHMHSSTQFKFEFTADASGQDMGYWFDDMVVIYDQKADVKEYNIDLQGVTTIGGLPGDWSITRLEVTNTGNISERYIPTASGVPAGWNHYFSMTNGANIGSSGMMLLPGESRLFDLRVLIDENASMGNIPVTINVTSNSFPNIGDGIETISKVLPDRMPNIILPEFTPRCQPGNTCDFPITVQNIGEATDVFTISLAEKNVPSGWSIALSWNQSTNVQVRIDNPIEIWMTATIPVGVEPDTTAEVWLTATSTNDSRRSDMKVVEVAAAMISNADISVSEHHESINYIGAGETIDVTFRIWNNASRMDVFRPDIETTGSSNWVVELLNTPDLAINSGRNSTFTIRVTAPITAQAEDPGPMITPNALSLRSGDIITGNSWQGIRVNTVHDLAINVTNSPSKLSPGEANLIEMEITNNGNGPAIAVVDLPWIADSWDWWILHEGNNVTSGIPLSVSYDLDNIKTVNLWLYLPPLESANEFHEISISVSPQDGTDNFDSDNVDTFESVTKTMMRPQLDGFPEEAVISTDSTFTLNATAWNIGNAADGTIRARLVLSPSPATSSVLGFLSTDSGASTEDGKWINLNLGPTESTELTVSVIIGEDVDLDTRITIRIELEGGQDDLGRPILKTLESMLLVGERRQVEIDDVDPQLTELDEGDSHVVWVNLTSTSTQGEIIFVNATVPEGWGVICDGNPIHLQGVKLELNAGHVSQQKYDMRCEVIRESGSIDGTALIEVSSDDGTVNHTISSQMNWVVYEEETGILSTTQIMMIIGGVLLLAVIIFMVRRKVDLDEDEEDDYEEPINIAAQPTQGPPATAFAGPPATVQQTVVQQPVQEVATVQDAAMTEYELQVAEYNRKMAEYEAWQATQSSQQ